MIQFKKEDSPSYIVCDGKTNGPTKRKVDHLRELDRAEEDESVLAQGSSFESRVFLSESRERRLVCKLLTDTVSYDEFLESDDVTSENGRMLSTLIARLSLTWPSEVIPEHMQNSLDVWLATCKLCLDNPWSSLRNFATKGLI